MRPNDTRGMRVLEGEWSGQPLEETDEDLWEQKLCEIGIVAERLNVDRETVGRNWTGEVGGGVCAWHLVVRRIWVEERHLWLEGK